MGYFPVLVPFLAIVATVLGLLSIVITNNSSCAVRVYWGRWFFLLVFLSVATGSFALALTWPRGVLPLCLAMAVLFLGILWQPSTPAEKGEVY